MLVLLVALLLMNLLVLTGILALPTIIKVLFSSTLNLAGVKLDTLGMKLVAATLMLVLNSLFLVVGGVALVA